MKTLVVFTLLLLAACTPAVSPDQVDLYSDSQSARATANAALQQAQLQEQFLTATAQAPIVHITETAAGLSVQATQAAGTSTAGVQTQFAAMTTTAIWWTPTPNATSTAVAVLAQAEATQQANQLELDRLEVERTRSMNGVAAMAPYFVGFLIVVILLMFGIVQAKRLAYMPQKMDERGKPIPMVEVIQGVAWDIDRAPNGMIGVHPKFLAQLPQITAGRQDQVTARAQMVDLATRAQLTRRLQHLLNEQGQELLPAPVQPLESRFLLPSWEIINGWDGKNGIPYYTERGLQTIDIERFPHISAIGATGAGKSRRFFRPLIACALVAGHRVVIIGKSADYWPFEDHPNATLLRVNKITEPGQAQRYAKILEAVVVEMNRRDDVLTAAHQSTWTHAGRNRTFVVLDEVGNALRLMEPETSKQARIWIEGLVSESRKVGFNIVLANQRATGMASILSQTGKAIFRVEADEERAHRSLIGASSLSDGYFLARFGITQVAGAFEPTDDELRAFLASRPVSKVEDDDQWIDAVISDTPDSLPSQSDALPGTSMAQLVGSLDDQGMKIIEMHQAGSSLNEIQRTVFGFTGGAAYNKVSELIRQYKAAASTTTTQNLSFQGSTG